MSLHELPPRDLKDQSPDEIAATLERERQDLALSLDGLRNRLSADMLVGDAMGYAKANLGPYVRALDGAVRANPMAAVMAGVGLAWLVLGRKAGPSLPEPPLAGTKYEALSRWEDEGGPPAPLPDPDTAWIGEADAVRARAARSLARIDAAARRRQRPAAELALDRARVLADLANATRSVMLRGLETLSTEARDRLLSLREEAYAARLAAVRQGSRLIEDRPLTAGAIGMAIGAAVGAALPRTETEDRLFGAERDRLMAMAHEALRHERRRVGHTVARLAETVAADVKDSAVDLVSQSA